VALARCGSVLAYASLADRQVDGQLSIEEIRTAFAIFQIN
jgi:3-dehydroquinate dehydratase